MKNLFLMNVLLAITWVALTGKFLYGNLLFGFFLSYLIIWLMARGQDDKMNYFRRMPQVIGFFFFFLKELIKANIEVAYDVITPRDHMKPGIIGFPLRAKSDLEITLLSNFITLTPGTLGLDISTDRKTMYIHAMYIDDPDEFIADLRHGFERRLLEILR